MLVCTLSFMLPCTATFLFDVLQQLCRFPNFKTSRFVWILDTVIHLLVNIVSIMLLV